MSIEIRKVSSVKDLNRFIDFHYQLYKGQPAWVPPLRKDEVHALSPKKNPAFDFCDAQYWLAWKDGRIVGRIAAFVNHNFVKVWKTKGARFGWIDFIDDAEVSRMLLEQAAQWAIDQGMESIHGPLSFTDFDATGLLIEGFDELATFGSGYNFPYYEKHFEKHNFTKDVDYIEFQVTMKDEIPEKVERVAKIAASRNKLHILRVKKAKEMLKYAHDVFYLINDAYSHLYGFVPMTERQVDHFVKQYFGFIKPEYVPVVLDEHGKLAAFGITMPSLSRALQKNNGRLYPFGFIHLLRAMKNNPVADLYLTAVRPDLQNKGVNAMLIYEMNKVYKKLGIQYVETNRELESNNKIQSQWRFYDARQHKKRRVYKKSLV